MAKTYGTLQLLDELATIDKDNVFTYGEDRLYSHINDLLAAHNDMTQDVFGLLVGQTKDNIRRFGADVISGEMVEVDEFGAADVQKTRVTGYDIGFPLRDYQYAIGWTKKYFETHTPSDIAKEFVASKTADIRNLKRRALQAFFRATNYSFIDRLTNSQTLPIKALQNADSTAIPVDPFGTAFNSATHTHLVGYASASVVAADITALIRNITEHGVQGGVVRIFINRAQEATVRGFTSNFDGLQPPRLDPGPGSTADVVLGPRDTPYLIDDRLVGIWDGFVEIWVKPWMPPNYYAAVLMGGTNEDVLQMRTRNIAGYGTFRMVAEHDHFPLRAQHFEREFGVGIWNRLGAAIMYGGATTYTQPTISY
jgi:hypothetical protein